MHSFIGRKIFGITGNIASGKSLALNYLANKGYPVFNADKIVNELYNDANFCSKVLGIFNEIDRGKITEAIYEDRDKKARLEKLVHPIIDRKLEEFISSLNDGEIGFAEIPLLFETRMERFFDYTILIYCDRDVRLKRAIERGISREKFDMIDSMQMSEELKIKYADIAIDSNVSLGEFEMRLDEVVHSE